MVVSLVMPASRTLLLASYIGILLFQTPKSQLNSANGVFSLDSPRSTLNPGGSCYSPLGTASFLAVV